MAQVTVRAALPAPLKQDVSIRQHRLTGDEETALGGTDAGPNPFELLLSALGCCTSMTLEHYATRKGWPLAGVTVKLEHKRGEKGEPDTFTRELTLEGALDAEQRARLLEIANKCPVHKTLSGASRIETRLV